MRIEWWEVAIVAVVAIGALAWWLALRADRPSDSGYGDSGE